MEVFYWINGLAVVLLIGTLKWFDSRITKSCNRIDNVTDVINVKANKEDVKEGLARMEHKLDLKVDRELCLDHWASVNEMKDDCKRITAQMSDLKVSIARVESLLDNWARHNGVSDV